NFTIFDADQAERETKRTLERLNHSPKRWNPGAGHSTLSSAKNQLITPAEFAQSAFDPFTRVVADVYPAYQASLKEQNAFDFDDLLVMPVRLFEGCDNLRESYQRRSQFTLVDEYQDTNRAQYR